MTALTLFACTFALVFALGLQSQFTNGGHYAAAFLNSGLIGTAQLLVLKLGPDASGLEIAGYILGGPFGIVAAMAAFRCWFRRSRCPTDPR
ncbi:hypothetical protein [Chitiniphilus shinanonensis]|uniref:hypothetical protein n=1 Tax=Chitiniphilus shinanonensis TaxID=553088 RepID=UPI003071C199